MEKSNIIDMNLSICAKKKIFGKKSAVKIKRQKPHVITEWEM
jgi:hypothetical protein